MAMTYLRTAAQVPVIQGPNSILNPVSGSYVALSGSPANVNKVQDNAYMSFAIVSGLGLDFTADSLIVSVAAGQALFDRVKDVAGAISVTIEASSASRVYLWLSENGNVVQVADSTTAPTTDGRVLYLGQAVLTGSVVTAVDGSGRIEGSGSYFWRRTYDVLAPADTPPVYVSFFNRSRTGIFLWDGSAYRAINPYDVSSFIEDKPTSSQVLLRFVAARPLTIPAVTGAFAAKAGTSATAAIDFSVKKNGTAIALLHFAASGTVATPEVDTADTSIAVGDVITIEAPGYADSTLAKIGFTILAFS